MNKKLAVLAVTTAVTAMTTVIPAFGQTDYAIKKYQVKVDKSLMIPYDGPNKQLFPNGFVPGFGSGLAVKSYKSNGDMELYAITDRGPNGDGPSYANGTTTTSAKYFPTPNFTPEIGIIKVQGDSAEVKEAIALKDATGKPLSGRPLTPGKVGSTLETGLDMNMNMKVVPYDDNGIDTEAIAKDKDGNFWVCDEYGPFIVKYDKDGKQLAKYAPGDGLPEIIKNRTPNRGIECLTITPAGKVVAIVQSVLDIDGKTSKTAQFLRIIELDPATGKTKMYAYQHEVASYKSTADAKLGDIIAISDTRFLLIEQGKDKDGKMHNYIFSIDTTGATDITDKKYDGKELEYATDLSVTGIKPVAKQKLMDLRDYGWTAEKAEGLCILPDNKTIMVINDNDFGLAMEIKDAAVEKPKITDYTLNSNGTYTYKGKEAKPEISLDTNGEGGDVINLWAITLDKTIDELAINASKNAADVKNPKTGDANIALYVTLLLASGMTFAVAFRKAKQVR